MDQYLIEETVAFFPTEKKLLNAHTHNEVTISILAADILSLLLARHGEVVTRETIFTDVIDPRGGASTNNNLNQYILNLRKQLVFLGIEVDVIETVPRIGFMIPAAVQIVRAVAKPETPQPAETVETPAAAEKIKRPFPAKTWTMAMVGVMAIALLFEWRGHTQEVTWDNVPSAEAVQINQMEGCQVFLIPSGISVNAAESFDYRSIINAAEKMTCEKGVTTRYYVFHHDTEGVKYRNFVLRCTHAPDTGPACYSHYKGQEY
jgi:DNA-binding winged helix-turn-helix (wHTH) protein